MKKLWLSLALFAAILAPHAIAAPTFTQYTKPAFETALKSQAPVIIHVYADWCSTCQKQLPGLAATLAEPELAKTQAIRVNFDTDREFLMTHRVPNQSVILVFKNGQEVLRLNGVTNADQIKSKIKSVL